MLGRWTVSFKHLWNVYIGILIAVTQGQVNFATSVNGRKLKGVSFGRKPFETPKHRVTGRIDTLNRSIATSDSASWRQGYFRSRKVTSSFFSATTFDREARAMKKTICIHADYTDQVICNMAFRIRSLSWPSQFFNITFLRSNFSSFDACWQEKHDVGNMNVVS